MSTVSHKKKTNRSAPVPQVILVSLSKIWPSPENDQLYRPVDPADPDIIELSKSILQFGLREPLVITKDGWLVSGHRRFVAAKLAGLETVPVQRIPIRRIDDLEAFVRLLREHNRQRDKTNAEKLREEIVSISPGDAHAALYEYRREAATVKVKPLTIHGVQRRAQIGVARQELLHAAIRIINERRKFWPLSVRQIHYPLLNNPPLKHAKKRLSRYKNDRASYQVLVKLLTSARLAGMIPFEAIGDETRPVELWPVRPNARSFIRDELNDMFRYYWRDLMQSQPNHIEIIGEKNTVLPILKPVALEYTIPLTIGRGYCSLPPRQAMAERYRASGKDKLVLLLISDFDPDGEEIAHSFARSMRDDFGISDIHPIKVGLTAEQVQQFKLPPIMQAKVTSSQYKKFVGQHGQNVFELEALPPETLQTILRGAIESVIDRDAFGAEIDAERQDSAFILAARQTARRALADVELEDSSDEE